MSTTVDSPTMKLLDLDDDCLQVIFKAVPFSFRQFFHLGCVCSRFAAMADSVLRVKATHLVLLSETMQHKAHKTFLENVGLHRETNNWKQLVLQLQGARQCRCICWRDICGHLDQSMLPRLLRNVQHLSLFASWGESICNINVAYLLSTYWSRHLVTLVINFSQADGQTVRRIWPLLSPATLPVLKSLGLISPGSNVISAEVTVLPQLSAFALTRYDYNLDNVLQQLGPGLHQLRLGWHQRYADEVELREKLCTLLKPDIIKNLTHLTLGYHCENRPLSFLAVYTSTFTSLQYLDIGSFVPSKSIKFIDLLANLQPLSRLTDLFITITSYNFEGLPEDSSHQRITQPQLTTIRHLHLENDTIETFSDTFKHYKILAWAFPKLAQLVIRYSQYGFPRREVAAETVKETITSVKARLGKSPLIFEEEK